MLDLAQADRIAASYPPEARQIPRWERETYLTETQQLAWLLRFDPDAAAEVLSAREDGQIAQERSIHEWDGNSPHGIPHHD